MCAEGGCKFILPSAISPGGHCRESIPDLEGCFSGMTQRSSSSRASAQVALQRVELFQN